MNPPVCETCGQTATVLLTPTRTVAGTPQKATESGTAAGTALLVPVCLICADRAVLALDDPDVDADGADLSAAGAWLIRPAPATAGHLVARFERIGRHDQVPDLDITEVLYAQERWIPGVGAITPIIVAYARNWLPARNLDVLLEADYTGGDLAVGWQPAGRFDLVGASAGASGAVVSGIRSFRYP